MKKLYFNSCFYANLLIINVYVIILIPNNLFTQFIYNGSFENHKDNTYPIGLSETGSENKWGYKNNQLIKCIGFCVSNEGWTPPVLTGGYCQGWYWATLFASPDYFHMGGLSQAQVPNVGIYVNNTNIRESRYPYGYPSVNNDDSAFVGIRIISHKSLLSQSFTSYKEYIQSPLNLPITGPKLYEVKFYVSKSKYIQRSIKNLGIYLTQQPIVRPSTMPVYPLWNMNLAMNDQSPYDYLTNPQVYSDVLLDQTADEFGLGGWQEIKKYIYVEANDVFHYITLGNFQCDSSLWADIDPPFPWDSPTDRFELYYFVDNLSIDVIDESFTGTCICEKEIFESKIIQDFSNEDSTLCCYNYEIKIPAWITGLCSVSKILIKDGETILDERIADYPPINPRFNGMDSVTGSFCLDKFSQSKNITIQFYSRAGENLYTLLAHCTRNFELSCRCDCDALKPYPYPGNSPKFKLVKVDDSENGNCCWDMVLTNPILEDETNCELDLSDIHFTIMSMPPASYYTFTGETFIYNSQSSSSSWKRYQAPSDLIIVPGQSITIGRICSYGAPANEVELTFYFSNHFEPALGICDTILNQKISCCESIGCCNSFVLYADTIRSHVIDSSSYCTTSFMLDYINTADYCDFDDELSITLYNNTLQIGYYNRTLRLSDVYKFPIIISPIISFTGPNEFCLHITNLRTQEVCTQCIWVFCDEIIPGVPMDKGNIENSSIDRTIKIVPNPTDNWVDLYFNSWSNSDGLISLFSVTGQELVSKAVKVRHGRNSARLTTADIPSGIYQVIINIDGIIQTGTISISR